MRNLWELWIAKINNIECVWCLYIKDKLKDIEKRSKQLELKKIEVKLTELLSENKKKELEIGEIEAKLHDF